VAGGARDAWIIVSALFAVAIVVWPFTTNTRVLLPFVR